MAGTVEGIDSLYATDGNSVELLHESLAKWSSEEVTIEPVIDTVL